MDDHIRYVWKALSSTAQIIWSLSYLSTSVRIPKIQKHRSFKRFGSKLLPVLLQCFLNLGEGRFILLSFVPRLFFPPFYFKQPILLKKNLSAVLINLE